MSEIVWQKSSYSGSGDGTNCVEIGATRHTLALRESDNPTAVLHTHRPQLTALLRHIRTTTARR
jgi:ribulose-5-phosphate 4-epimerase/fuculose-1-phosphate aldolase